ncbi:acyl-CoA N-acyltransferase [Xylaria palmicola]|nr:acyl-CoA N-acyltransferase [Xylaria palmicola]
MAGSSLNFRLATAEDVVPLVSLINTAFCADTTTEVFLSADHARVDVVDATGILAKINEPDCAVLAVADPSTGTIMAHGSVRRLANGRAWFGMLAVDVDCQGQGLGGRVLAWAEQHARRQWGAPRMEFGVVNTRAELIAWYGRRGYRATGEMTPFPYHYHGDWQGILRDGLCFITLGKDLGEAPGTSEVA